MDDVFYKISRESSGQRHLPLRQACQDAIDMLASQQALIRIPAYEVRQKCFDALRLALESKEKKLISLSLCGMQKLLRDQISNPDFEPENEELWLPCQLTNALASIVSYHEDIQIEGLKLILQCTVSNSWYLSQDGVQAILQLCIDIYRSGSSTALHIAVVATASQTVQSYMSSLMEPCKDVDENLHVKCPHMMKLYLSCHLFARS